MSSLLAKHGTSLFDMFDCKPLGFTLFQASWLHNAKPSGFMVTHPCKDFKQFAGYVDWTLHIK